MTRFRLPRHLILAAVCTQLLGATAHADQPPQGSGAMKLTLSRAISLARERAPEVRMAQHRVREAEATRVGAGIVMPTRPRLSVDLRQSLVGGEYRTRELGYAVTLDTMFDIAGAPSARVREADMRTRSATVDAELVRFYAGLDAWRAYLAASIATQRIADLNDARAVADRVLAASRERISAGAAGDIEEMTARLEVAQLQATLESVKRERSVSLMQLRDLLDLPAGTALEVSAETAVPQPPPPLEALLRHAEKARPELAAIRSHLQLLEATATRLEREVAPRVGIFGTYDTSPHSATFIALGASVELPVAQRNQGPLAVNMRERESDHARLELELRRIDREVAATRAAYESRRAELRALADEAVPAAERNLLLIETGWRSGRFDIFRVTSAARDLVRMKAMQLDALEAAWVERIALERAAGGWPS